MMRRAFGTFLVTAAVSIPVACINDDGKNGGSSNGIPPGDQVGNPPDVGTDVNVPDGSGSEPVRLGVDETHLTAVMGEGQAQISLPITRLSGHGAGTIRGAVDVALRDLDRQLIAFSSLPFTLEDAEVQVDVTLSDLPDILGSDDDEAALARYLLHYRVSSDAARLLGKRSLFVAARKRQVRLLGSDVIAVGGTSFLRVMATEADTGTPLGEADIVVEYVPAAQGATAVPLYRGKTDASGMASATLELADADVGRGELQVTVTSTLGTQRVVETVTVERQEKVLLTTDKPRYQPGQLIHMRALALQRPQLKPLGDDNAVFEVTDSKGTKIFREQTRTNAYGIAATQLRLATLINEGSYTVRATVGNTFSERTVTVEKYVLPKFSVKVSTDEPYYRIEDQVTGHIRSDYFFGKPVAGATVLVEAYAFDIDYQLFASNVYFTDDYGATGFSFTLPSYLVGSALDQGKAHVRVDVTVTDLADHTQTTTLTLPVVADALTVAFFPEGDRIYVGHDNRFYLLVSDPVGRPVQAHAQVVLDGTSHQVVTASNGLATVSHTPQGDVSGSVTVDDGLGHVVAQQVSFKAGQTQAGQIRLRTDRALYRAGDSATLTADVSGPVMRIFVDAIRGGQTVLTDALDVTDGQAQLLIDLTEQLVGELELSAYAVSPGGELVRDQRIIYVDPASDLRVRIDVPEPTYRPGHSAALGFSVADEQGTPVQAALGITIVDEAVYALQQMQPGLEKVYFYLADQLLTPRYELHGFSMTDLVVGTEQDEQTREQTAEVLFAASGGQSQYGIDVDTYADTEDGAHRIAQEAVEGLFDVITDLVRSLSEAGGITYDNISTWVDANATSFVDPWGAVARLSMVDAHTVGLHSAGPDETLETGDDVQVTRQSWQMLAGRAWEDDVMMDTDGAVADAPQMGNDASAAGGGGSGGGAPRVRRYFPETLAFVPALITEPDGTATLDLTLADSITTWRLTAMASSSTGQLGSRAAGITVFQDFFVDLDLPRTMTQNDEVSVPVAIYNYLTESQSIELTLDTDPGPGYDWFTLAEGSPSRTRVLDAGEITVEYFRVRVDQVGWRELKVTAIGTHMSDAVARSVQVKPDGKPVVSTVSGPLSEDLSHTVTIPANAIADASTLSVKVYPGLLSQVVEGLDSMLRMPCGCFEQTSSATYPNVLVLDYLRSTDSGTAEIELKAEQYITQGYQRLLSFEVAGGGFEWFGNAPAHNILTAYGLFEFTDMAAVHFVDPAVIERTQRWLALEQDDNGSFTPTAGGIAEGAINSFDSTLRTTAYLTWALSYSGYDGPEVNAGLAYVKNHRNSAADPYTHAQVANALLSVSPSDPDGLNELSLLDAQKVSDADGSCHWNSAAMGLTYNNGNAMTIETTALVAFAMLQANAYPGTVQCAIDFLVQNKDALGNWSTTQATIATLRTLLKSLSYGRQQVDATVLVSIDGAPKPALIIDETNSDVMFQIDVTSGLAAGSHEVVINFAGEGRFMYQIIDTHYLPWQGQQPVATGPLSITVAYDRSQLQVDDILAETVTVTNTVPGSSAEMVLVDLGVPPGFDLVFSDLDDEIQHGEISRFELAGSQLILYLYEVAYGTPVVIDFGLRARFPLRAQAPVASAYLYYDPEQRAQTTPTQIEVTP